MAQQEFKTFSISSVFINPSIMEGEMAIPGVLVPEAAIPIDRYPPENTTPPYVSGDSRIPAVLTANPGVWTGSPKPSFTYQWYNGAEALAGETGKTLLTYDALSDGDISFEIVAFSTQGSITLQSAPLTVQSVYPVDIEEASYYVITGSPITDRSVIVTHRFYTVSGQPTETQLFQASHDVYVVETV